MSEPSQRCVEEVMATPVTTLSPDERLDLAEDVMQAGRIRHMPVVEGDRLVGVVSARDVLAASLSRSQDYEPTHRRAFLRWVVTRDVMTEKPVTVGPGDSLAEAAELLCKRAIGCLPVVDEDDHLLGLLTATDLLRAAYLEDGAAPVLSMERAREGLRSIGSALADERDALRRSREELELKIHLGKADARDRWRELEGRWHQLEGVFGDLAEGAKEPLHEVEDAAEELMEELRRGYRRLRRALLP